MIYNEEYFNKLDERVKVHSTEEKLIPSNKKSYTIDWVSVHRDMKINYPELQISLEGIRSQWRRRNDPAVKQLDKRAKDARVGRTTLEERVLPYLKNKVAVGHLAVLLGATVDEVLLAITKLSITGYSGVHVWQEANILFAQNMFRHKPDEHVANIYAGDTIIIGVVSDTHLGSNQEALDELKTFYNYCADRGVNAMLHVGDVTDGYYMQRQTSIFEQHRVGFQQQLDYVIDNYPEIAGVNTYFITGNHDFTHYRNGGADLGTCLSRERGDMVYLGHNFGTFIVSEHCKVSLRHPTDGVTQSLSLKLRQMIDRAGNDVGDIYLAGHYHKYVNEYYKGVYGYLLPSFQHQTGFMRDNNITSLVGGLILTLNLDDEGYLMSVTTEYVDLGKRE